MVDIADMCKTNELFKTKFKGLLDLTDYGSGKLGVYNDATYISWNYFQGLQRRFYGESIDTLIPFLNSTIDDYSIFYNMILFFIMLNCYNSKTDKKLSPENTLTCDASIDSMVKTNINIEISDKDMDKLYILKEENKKFMEKMCCGLTILKIQYDSQIENQAKINTLIDKIKDLKDIFFN